MESKIDRKEAIKQFKARPVSRGVFAVRCTATGEAWVGSSRNLEAAPNGLWFQLKLGSCLNRSLQDAWNTHGPEAFRFDVLEKLDEDLPALNVNDAMKQTWSRWVEQLGAHKL